MIRYADCPQILKDFLSYHETIKGQSAKTIQEYYLDLRMFLRFMVLVKREMPYDTDLNTIEIKDVNLAFIETISVSDIFDFLSYLANDRIPAEYAKKRLSCKKDCRECGYCAKVQAAATVNLEHM